MATNLHRATCECYTTRMWSSSMVWGWKSRWNNHCLNFQTKFPLFPSRRGYSSESSPYDPINASTFQSNTDTYHDQLEDLHNWILAQLEEIPQADRKLVTDHLFMGYFAQRYDFEIINALLPAFSSAASPSARELADIQDSIRQSGVEVIFIGITSNRQIAEQIAGDTSVYGIPQRTQWTCRHVPYIHAVQCARDRQ